MSRNNFSETNYGYTDIRGEWRPEKPVSFAPVFVWPPKLRAFLRWLFNYLFTWNLFYLAIVLISYNFLQPPLEQMRSFRPGWMAILFIRNMALVWIIYGGWHFYLYVLKKRGTIGKYCPRWQSTKGSTFLWNNQVYDNIFWTCAVGVPVWTTYEAISFWLYATHKLPYLDFHQHPVLFILVFLLIPFWREFHFYIIHRLIHWKPLYRRIHYLHHYNINPGPWSGLAMHPLEHILYFSVVLIHWVIPSHPLHFLFNSQHTALTPAPGHTGFEGKIVKVLPFGSYFHYLHHRLFDCNYGESTLPLDKWFGIFEDGSQTPYEKMEAARAYQKLQVSRIEQESAEVKSFYFKAAGKSELKPAIPGQHLRFRFPFSDDELLTSESGNKTQKTRYYLRSYTVSNAGAGNEYRISVKAESNGKVSTALHQNLKKGDIIEAKGPLGNFTYKRNKKKAGIFIAAGIGITPILAMLDALPSSKADNYLILAAKTNLHMCFTEEIKEICAKNPGLHVFVFFSRQDNIEATNLPKEWKQHNKRISFEDLVEILGVRKAYDFYICGPDKMTTHLRSQIQSGMNRKSRVYTESFGNNQQKESQPVNDKAVEINFSRSNQTIAWDNTYHNILEFAESNGISLEAGCMFGECGACSTEIKSGSVTYNYATATKPAKGSCLPCSCRPESDLTINA